MKAAGRNWCVGIACTPRIALNPVSWLEIPYSILIPLFYRVARSYSTLLPILTSFFVMNGKHYLPLFALFSHHLLHYLFPRWIHHRAIHRNRVIYYIPMNPVIQVELRFWTRLRSCEWQSAHRASEPSRSGICDRCIHYGKEWRWWSRVRFSISSHIGLLHPHNILWRCGPILTVTDQTHLLTLNNSQYQLEVEFNGNNHN